MLKTINKFKSSYAMLLLVAGCSYGSWMDAASTGTIECEKKVSLDRGFSKYNLKIEPDQNQF